MKELESFIDVLKGRFNNKEQFERIKDSDPKFPYAEHVNTVCNDKIKNLPADFNGYFMVEESYYTMGGSTRPMPHLFLFTIEGDKVKLTSYDMPEGFSNDSFKYENIESLNFESLSESKKFTPALYENKDGVWEGGSVSMFTPVLKFTLYEKFSEDCLAVTETMEVNGKKTFGFDEPIEYKRA